MGEEGEFAWLALFGRIQLNETWRSVTVCCPSIITDPKENDQSDYYLFLTAAFPESEETLEVLCS